MSGSQKPWGPATPTHRWRYKSRPDGELLSGGASGPEKRATCARCGTVATHRGITLTRCAIRMTDEGVRLDRNTDQLVQMALCESHLQAAMRGERWRDGAFGFIFGAVPRA